MAPIRVVDYDPSWPHAFASESAGIAFMLGNLLAEIHHVGSTAVPGLAAKPKIDIDAVIRPGHRLEEAVARMRLHGGYTCHGDPYGDGMWTFTAAQVAYPIPAGTRLYLCAPGNPTHERRLHFRDWLRCHDDAAADYAALKRRLAVEGRGDWTAYTGGKADFVRTIVGLAIAARMTAPGAGLTPPASTSGR